MAEGSFGREWSFAHLDSRAKLNAGKGPQGHDGANGGDRAEGGALVVSE